MLATCGVHAATLRKAGQFTQIVWKASQQIGVGRAFANKGRTVYVVCNYFPAGNCPLRIKDNIFPAK